LIGIDIKMVDDLINGKPAADWLLEPRPDSFFRLAGTHNLDECTQLFLEITKYYRPLAYAIINLSLTIDKKLNNCRMFRHLLYIVYEKLGTKGIDLHLPYYWYMDGVMVEPEFIVRITNGIIGWKCDESRDGCGMKSDCIFWEDEI
jgi:hypothetical protein